MLIKNKKASFQVGIPSFIALLIVFGISYGMGQTNSQDIEIQSQCYTKIQPSRYFEGSPNPVYTANNGTKLIAESDYELRTGQALDSGSMRPTISDYSTIIIVEPRSPNDIKVGDVVSIKRDGKKNLLHRVIRIEGGKYITKGDNSNLEDKINWNYEQIDGKLVGVLY